MLVQLLRPMAREGSSKKYFVQRIPADVKASAVGMTLMIPLGDTLVPVKVTSKTQWFGCRCGPAIRARRR